VEEWTNKENGMWGEEGGSADLGAELHFVLLALWQSWRRRRWRWEEGWQSHSHLAFSCSVRVVNTPLLRFLIATCPLL
jgi:hypothetical protein